MYLSGEYLPLVLSVLNHFRSRGIWRNTRGFTLARGRTNVLSVLNHFHSRHPLAHTTKIVLGMVSPVFHKMLFVLWREDKEVLVEGMTPAAFKIMKNAIYNVMSMEKSLKGKSATEVFVVLDLVKRYQIHELKKIVLDHLSSSRLYQGAKLTSTKNVLVADWLKVSSERNAVARTCQDFRKDETLNQSATGKPCFHFRSVSS